MILERRGRFAVKAYVGKDETGRSRYAWLGTFETREEAEATEGRALEVLDRWAPIRKGEKDCRVCGATAEHLHHIVPVVLAPAGLIDVAGNGLPLCQRCHYGWHRRTVAIWQEALTVDELVAAVNYAGAEWLAANYPARDPSSLSEREQALCEAITESHARALIAEEERDRLRFALEQLRHRLDSALDEGQ